MAGNLFMVLTQLILMIEIGMPMRTEFYTIPSLEKVLIEVGLIWMNSDLSPIQKMVLMEQIQEI